MILISLRAVLLTAKDPFQNKKAPLEIYAELTVSDNVEYPRLHQHSVYANETIKKNIETLIVFTT